MASPTFSQEDTTAVQAHVQFAVNRLKDKFPESQSYDDLMSYVWPEGSRTHETRIPFWNLWIKKHPKISYDAESELYRFKPLHNIASADDLVRYLQTQPTANGLQVRDLKDGWPNAEQEITELEAKHKVLVHRNKKDQQARMVWADNPALYHHLDDEFRGMWLKVPLPGPEETIKELARIGYKPAGQIKAQVKAPVVAKKKAKRSRGTKVTNTHIQHVFKDYSGKRAQAQKR